MKLKRVLYGTIAAALIVSQLSGLSFAQTSGGG